MNTFTGLVSYLFRCNTDVTSLLSGTALKAVIAYISDYISKPSLKTYVVFDTIRSVFDKNVQLINGSSERGEKARKIMTQIVNSLTSKMEIGAPMASLYLLGNPDHYTSHKFVPIYWKSYVAEARRYWADEQTTDDPDSNMVLQRIKGSVVGTSPIFDYIYRPAEFGDMSLYNWVRLSEKNRIPRPKDNAKEKSGASKRSGKYSEYYKFLPDHPLYSSHHVRILLKGEGKVPNFVGGSLPRHDKGDQEYYASTMLTLFAPWRSGAQLKPESLTWMEQFEEYSFSLREREIMKFFNVRYECLDARDDYSAQLKEDQGKIPPPEWAADEYHMDDGEHWAELETTFTPFDSDSIIDNSTIGKLTAKWNYDKAVVQNTLQTSGWLAPPSSSLTKKIRSRIIVDDIPPSQWKLRVKQKRDEVQELRQSNMAKNPSRHSTTSTTHAANLHPNEVRLVDNSFLDKNFKHRLKKDLALIDKLVRAFDLNTEQERAFRIVTNHATLENPVQLKMHLGGMGGTGKSRVIKALTAFFKDRDECHRMITLAPTGSAAALIGGFT
ncbi:hypothetical protein BJ138DRAFT_1016259, partial [Hygrophoropsis aurantiaca]